MVWKGNFLEEIEGFMGNFFQDSSLTTKAQLPQKLMNMV